MTSGRMCNIVSVACMCECSMCHIRKMHFVDSKWQVKSEKKATTFSLHLEDFVNVKDG